MTEIVNCIFCNNPLDNSDEHVIPDCLNGKLKSTKIICYNCNSKKFGRYIDPEIKKIFNKILFILGFNNASSLLGEDPTGKSYIFTKDGKINQQKPDLKEIKLEGLTILSVEGTDKNAIKYFKKHTEKLLEKGHTIGGSEQINLNHDGFPLKIEFKVEITTELIILLNKIALEFYALKELDLDKVKELANSINNLDKTLTNVVFCNLNKEIRDFKEGEITHLIQIKTNKKGELYCYIELFNVICAYILLEKNSLQKADFTFYQDVITGEVFNEEVITNLDSEVIANEQNNFENLLNALFFRKQERDFTARYREVIQEIKKYTEEELRTGEIKEEDFNLLLATRCCEEIARISLEEFPYLIDDFGDVENDDFNFINSNIRIEKYPLFIEENKSIINKIVVFPDKETYIFESFMSQPSIKKNGIELVKIFCVLRHVLTQNYIYIPHFDFAKMININATNA